MDTPPSPKLLQGQHAGSLRTPGPVRPLARPQFAPDAAAFDFLASSPLAPSDAHVATRAAELAGRVGLGFSLSTGRTIATSCRSLVRALASALGTGRSVWWAVDCGELGRGALLVDHGIAVALADALMGGSGQTQDRAPSTVESALLATHLVDTLAVLAPVAEAAGVPQLRLAELGEDLPAALDGRSLLCITLDLSIGEADRAVVGEVTLALPSLHTAGEPIEPEPLPAPDPTSCLIDVPLTVQVRLPSITLSAADVRELGVGDVIRTGHDPDAQVLGLCDGIALFTAYMGRTGTARTVSVSRLLDHT